jgi:alkylresorcinol/alkylpyrone synthase
MPDPERTTPRALDDSLDPSIGQVSTTLPENRYEQSELVAALERHWSGQHYNADRLRRLHERVKVGGRNLALPLEDYARLDGFGDRNDAFIEVGTELGQRAVADALDRAGLDATDVDAIFFTTVTGLSTPTLDARIANRLQFRRDVKRIPLFGLGCVAGAAGIARMSEYLRAHPDDVAVLLSVELCSLTMQPEDLSVANLIASGLFGDGAAAVVGLGARRALTGLTRPPRVEATRSVFYRDTEWVMGWDIDSNGFSVVLSAKLPALIRDNLRGDVDSFLEDHNLSRGSLDRYVAHPGGPAVLEAMEDALEVDRSAFEVTWESLERIGNLSSASVLFVLQETLERIDPQPGETGLLFAMGPGFCAELVLLRW